MNKPLGFKGHAPSFEIKESGIYYVDENSDHTDCPKGTYGVLIVFGGMQPLQVYIEDNLYAVYMRHTNWGGGKWYGGWKEIKTESLAI